MNSSRRSKSILIFKHSNIVFVFFTHLQQKRREARVWWPANYIFVSPKKFQQIFQIPQSPRQPLNSLISRRLKYHRVLSLKGTERDISEGIGRRRTTKIRLEFDFNFSTVHARSKELPLAPGLPFLRLFSQKKLLICYQISFTSESISHWSYMNINNDPIIRFHREVFRERASVGFTCPSVGFWFPCMCTFGEFVVEREIYRARIYFYVKIIYMHSVQLDRSGERGVL